MRALQTLATSLAFVIDADKTVSVEEKAKLLAVLHRHVNSGDLDKDEIREISAQAFETAKTADLERFLAQVAPKLTTEQKMAILLNLYDVMMADGVMMGGEVGVISKFEQAFNVDMPTVEAVREVMTLKNDPSLFTNELNSRNDPDYVLRLSAGR